MPATKALSPLLLGGFSVLSVTAQKYVEGAETYYRIGIHRSSDGVHLIALISVHDDNGDAGHVAVQGQLVWKDDAFEVPPVQATDDDFIKLVAESSAVHTLYDAGALALRHSLASIASEIKVAYVTPEPELELIQGVSEDEDLSSTS